MKEELHRHIQQHIKNGDLDSAQRLLLDDISNIDRNDNTETSNKIHFAHYTSLDTVYSLLIDYKNKEENGLRLYDAESLNDTSEGKVFKDYFAKTYDFLNYVEKTTTSDEIFICSFVSGDEKVGDKLQYWQSYGKDGLGCSIQLSRNYQKNTFDKISYINQFNKDIKDSKKDYGVHLKLGQELHKKLNGEDKKDFANTFWKKFDNIKFLYKSDHYKQENEYRHISHKQEKIKYHFKKEGPYLRKYILIPQLSVGKLLMSGSKIVIGPRVHDKKRMCRNLKKLATQVGLLGPEFIPSEINYRKVW